MHKFEKLVVHIKQLIENNTWPAETRLPSLRSQAQLADLSLMTVLNAYQELEAQGLIYAKGKSGFFVAKRPSHSDQCNTEARCCGQNLDPSSLVYTHFKAIQNLPQLSFAAADPDEQLLNNARLSKIVAKHAKQNHLYHLKEHMPPGHLGLRQLIARQYQLQGVAVTGEDIVITSGALEALNLSLQSLTQAGDYILLQQTGYYAAWQAAERLGLKIISIPEHPQHGVDLEAMAEALANYPIKVCWLMLNSQEPVGYSVSDSIKAQIAALLSQHQVYLIEDDTNQELYFSGTKPLPMNYFYTDLQVLHCSSFSKILGPSMRIGWVCAGGFSDKIQHLQLMSSLAANPLLQSALAEFIATHHYDKQLHQLRFHLSQRKQQHYQLLQRYLANCSMTYYPSAYFIWIKLPDDIDAMQLSSALLTQQIAITPSQLFSLAPSDSSHIRLNCSAEVSEQTIHAIKIMASTLQTLLQQSLMIKPEGVANSPAQLAGQSAVGLNPVK